MESRREAAPVGEGWTRRFAAEAAKAAEYAQLYEELGFEVRLEPVELEADDGHCAVCLKGTGRRYLAIFTRPRT